MRLIDADALLEAVKDSAEINVGVITALVTHVSLSDVMETITNAPTIQREGWVSVPIEPTEEMLRAGCEAGLDFKTLMDDTPYSTDLATYKAMISAAPTLKEKG